MGISVYLTALNSGLLDRMPSTPTEQPCRVIGRPPDERIRTGDGIAIHWPAAPHGRSRRVLSRSGARRRYVVPCFRGGERFAHCEAPEEATAAVLLDACYGLEFQEQPAKLEFEWRGNVYEHYPDVLVISETTTEFWELKKDHEADDIVFRRRSERISELLKALGYGYRMIPTRALHQASYYRNAIGMRRYAKLPARWPELAEYYNIIKTETAGHARKVLAFLPADKRMATLYACLYHGVLTADFSVPVSLDTYVHPRICHKEEVPWLLELLEKSS